MNKENLLKLATYLLSGDLKADFTMVYFTDRGKVKENYAVECGTAGCAAGHGPYAGIEKAANESWGGYVNRSFGIYGETFEWLFSSNWSSIDNTPEGAAKRILYLLRNGLPEDWHEQLYGNAPLCYLNETL